MNIRSYKTEDYDSIIGLYKNSSLYGGQFDENRDSREKLEKMIQEDPESILVYELENKILGTISLIENARVAWLFRFAVLPNNKEAGITLLEKASQILKTRGHNQVLVYSPVDSHELDTRYADLGFKKGLNYNCFWKNI